jgi:HEAT repeat protein
MAMSIDDGRWFRDPAADGLRGLGTNAALFLAREFRRGDPSWAPGYWKFFVRLPGPLKAMSPNPPVPRSYVRFQIASALQAMGADGAAAMPSLIEGLKGPDRSTRLIIMRTLRSLPRQPGDYDSVLDDLARRAQFPAALDLIEGLGIRTRKAGVILGEALAAGDLETGRRSVRQLQYLGPNAAFAVPALVMTLTNGDNELRYSATSALADIGPTARSALPALGRLANDSSEMVQRAAARALLAIGPELKESRNAGK